jgi:hypothetical protein
MQNETPNTQTGCKLPSPTSRPLRISIFEPVFCSEGTIENSPAFQCRDRLEERRVPQGRLKRNAIFSRPCGTRLQYRQTPAFKRRAIFKMSLQDMVFSNCTKTEIRHLRVIHATKFLFFPAPRFNFRAGKWL